MGIGERLGTKGRRRVATLHTVCSRTIVGTCPVICLRCIATRGPRSSGPAHYGHPKKRTPGAKGIAARVSPGGGDPRSIIEARISRYFFVLNEQIAAGACAPPTGYSRARGAPPVRACAPPSRSRAPIPGTPCSRAVRISGSNSSHLNAILSSIGVLSLMGVLVKSISLLRMLHCGEHRNCAPRGIPATPPSPAQSWLGASPAPCTLDGCPCRESPYLGHCLIDAATLAYQRSGGLVIVTTGAEPLLGNRIVRPSSSSARSCCESSRRCSDASTLSR